MLFRPFCVYLRLDIYIVISSRSFNFCIDSKDNNIPPGLPKQNWKHHTSVIPYKFIKREKREKLMHPNDGRSNTANNRVERSLIQPIFPPFIPPTNDPLPQTNSSSILYPRNSDAATLFLFQNSSNDTRNRSPPSYNSITQTAME